MNGKCNGKCKILYSNGALYLGDMKNDVKDGNGSFYSAIGSEYTGEWKNDSRNGNAMARWS